MANIRRPSHRFVPRRDLFPPSGPFPSGRQTDNFPNPEQAATAPDRSIKAAPNMKHKRPDKNKLFDIQPIQLFLLFLVLKLLGPKPSSAQKDTGLHIQKAFSGILENQDILNMLTDVSPYLSEAEQESIYSIIGIIEALRIIKSVKERTYQKQRVSALASVPMDAKSRKIGILRALKPYLPQEQQPIIEKVIQTHEASERLTKNIRIYRNNQQLMEDSVQNPVEKITELIKVVKPILPSEHQEKLDRVMKIAKMAEMMELTMKSGTGSASVQSVNDKEQDRKAEKGAQQGPELIGSMAKEYQNAGDDEKDPEKQDSAKKAASPADMMNALSSMMSDEQKKTMQALMDFAKLLSQPQEEEENEEK